MMKLRLTLLALALVLTLSACDAPLWANFEIIIKDADGVPQGLHYCIAWERRRVMFYCQQPENHVEKIELEPEQVLQVLVVNQIMP